MPSAALGTQTKHFFAMRPLTRDIFSDSHQQGIHPADHPSIRRVPIPTASQGNSNREISIPEDLPLSVCRIGPTSTSVAQPD